MDRYRLEYRVKGQRKWRAVTADSGEPYSKEVCDGYRHLIAARQAPKFVVWHDVELRMLKGGVPCG